MDYMKIAEYDHNDKDGYYYPIGKTIFSEENLLNRFTAFDREVPKAGIVNQFLIYSIVNQEVFLFKHSDSEKVPGGETRPSHHIELEKIVLNEEERQFKSVNLMYHLFRKAIDDTDDVIFPNNPVVIKNVTAILLDLYKFFPFAIKEKFVVRLTDKSQISDIFKKNSKICLYDIEKFCVVKCQKFDISDLEQKLYTEYVKEIDNGSVTLNKLERDYQFQMCNSYKEYIKKVFMKEKKEEKDSCSNLPAKESFQVNEKNLTDSLEKLYESYDIIGKIRILEFLISYVDKYTSIRDIYHEVARIIDMGMYKQTNAESDMLKSIMNFVISAKNRTYVFLFLKSLRFDIEQNHKGIALSATCNSLKKYYDALQIVNRTDLLKYVRFYKNKKVEILYNQLLGENCNYKIYEMEEFDFHTKWNRLLIKKRYLKK